MEKDMLVESKKDVLATSVGWLIIVIGIISSFMAGNIFKIVEVHGVYYSYTTEKYNWPVAVGGIISSVIFGLVFILIGEILYTGYENRKKIMLLSDKIDEMIPNNNGNNEDIKEVV